MSTSDAEFPLLNRMKRIKQIILDSADDRIISGDELFCRRWEKKDFLVSPSWIEGATDIANILRWKQHVESCYNLLNIYHVTFNKMLNFSFFIQRDINSNLADTKLWVNNWKFLFRSFSLFHLTSILCLLAARSNWIIGIHKPADNFTMTEGLPPAVTRCEYLVKTHSTSFLLTKIFCVPGWLLEN